MDLDIDGLVHLRVNNSFNSIVGYLNTNSLIVVMFAKKFKFIFFV